MKKALTPKQVAKEAAKLIKEKNNNVDLIIKEINRQLTFEQSHKPEDGSEGEGIQVYCSPIRWPEWPDKDAQQQSVRAIYRALNVFRKDWKIKSCFFGRNLWRDKSAYWEFTPKK